MISDDQVGFARHLFATFRQYRSHRSLDEEIEATANEYLDPAWIYLADALILAFRQQFGRRLGVPKAAQRQMRQVFLGHQRELLQEEVEREIQDLREQRRSELATEFETVQQRLDYLKKQTAAQTELARLAANLMFDRCPEYPRTPDPLIEANETGTGLPPHPGIYFVWNEAIIVYVGQSVDISQRARTKGHANIYAGDWISWLPFEKEILNFAECFYIGLHRPARNFSGEDRVRFVKRAIAAEGE